MPPFYVDAFPRRATSSLGPLNRIFQTLWLKIWALLGVPVTFSVYVVLAYRIALAHGRLPFLPSGGWRWVVAYFVSLASGVLAVALLPRSRLWVRVALAVGYLGTMGVFLFGASLVIGCSNGDCL